MILIIKQKPTKTSDQARDEARSTKKPNGAGGQSRPTPPPPNRNKKTNGKPASQTRPVAPPPGRKTKKNQKMYTAINTSTGKPDFDAPKVTAAQRLKQEDKYKSRKKTLDAVTSAAKASLKKKGKK